MKRTFFLLAAVLALVLAACGADQTDATASPTEVATPTETVAPTPDATASPTEDETAAATDGGGSGSGATGGLSGLLPDRVGALERVDIPPVMEQAFRSVLSEQGVDAEEADFVYATWGDAGELGLTALRAPGMDEPDFRALAEMMSRSMTASEMEADATATTVGGKNVLRVTPMAGGADATVYIYITDDTMFTIVAQREELAAELLGQLP